MPLPSSLTRRDGPPLPRAYSVAAAFLCARPRAWAVQHGRELREIVDRRLELPHDLRRDLLRPRAIARARPALVPEPRDIEVVAPPRDLFPREPPPPPGAALAVFLPLALPVGILAEGTLERLEMLP